LLLPLIISSREWFGQIEDLGLCCKYQAGVREEKKEGQREEDI
jgi:hypothetical protein